MIKTFLKDVMIYTLPTILSRGIGMFLLPIYTRISSPEELGALDIFLIFGNIIALSVALEISQGISRYIPEITDVKLKIAYSSTGLYFTFIMYFLFFVVAFPFYVELNNFLTGKNDYAQFFQLVLVYFALHGFFYYFQNLLRFEGNSVGYAVVSLMYAVANLFSAFLFGVIYDLGFIAILYSMILSVLLASLLGMFLLRKSFGFVFKPHLLKELLEFSVPLVPSSILIFVSLYADRYMINILLDLERVGIYSVGVRLASAAALVMVGFQMAISPIVYKNYNDPESPQSLALIFKYFVIFGVFFFLVYSLMIEELLFLLTTPEFYSVASIVPMLVLSFLFSNMYVFMPGIAIRKKTHLIFLISAVAVSLNIVLNFFLIPSFGLHGSAFSTMVSYFTVFLLYAFYSQKFYFVPHKWFCFVYIFSFALLSVGFYFEFFIQFNSGHTFLLRFVFIIFLFFLVFKLRLISEGEVKHIKDSIIKKINR